MIGYGVWNGERLGVRPTAGFICAFSGLLGLLLPGLTSPPLAGSIEMLGAGAAWGAYSLRGKGAGDPVGVTAGNFFAGRANGCDTERGHIFQGIAGWRRHTEAKCPSVTATASINTKLSRYARAASLTLRNTDASTIAMPTPCR